MGLIRRSLNIGTLGVVKSQSKKQRVAKATLESTERTEAMTRAQWVNETPGIEDGLRACQAADVPKKHLDRMRVLFEKGVVNPTEYAEGLVELAELTEKKRRKGK